MLLPLKVLVLAAAKLIFPKTSTVTKVRGYVMDEEPVMLVMPTGAL